MRNDSPQLEFAFSQPDQESLTLRQAWELCHRSEDHSAAYIKDIRQTLSHWERITGNPPVARISNITLRLFKEHFLRNPMPGKDRKFAPTTFNKYLGNINAILSAIGPKDRNNPFAFGLISDVPRVKPAPEEDAEPVVASLEEISAIYDACEVAVWPTYDRIGFAASDYWRALLVFLFNVGCRKSEFKLLTQQDCNLEAGIVLTRATKTGKKRPLPINATVVSHLRKIWLPRRAEVWYSNANNHDQRLYDHWEKIQRAADIHVPRPEGSERRTVYGFHELRKTCATEIYATNPGAAQMFCGHSSIETTNKFYVARKGILRKASEEREQPAAFLKGVG